jgi:hypothetical protein
VLQPPSETRGSFVRKVPLTDDFTYWRLEKQEVTPMAVLTFTLHPDAVGKFYDAFICLGKFSEAVSFEASKDNVSGCIFTTVTETDTK